MEIVPEEQADPIAVSALLHKLKSPLTIIMGYGDFALERWESLLDDEKFTLLTKIMGAACKLESSISSSMQSLVGRLNLWEDATPAPTHEVHTIVQHIVDDLAPCFPSIRLISLGCDVVPVLDPQLLQILIHHLVENAVAYGVPERGVFVDFVERPGFLGVSVTNYDDDCKPLLTAEVFNRGESSGGTGLGLWIVKNYLLEMHGEITLHQLSDGGDRFTTFTLWFPIAETERSDYEAESTSL